MDQERCVHAAFTDAWDIGSTHVAPAVTVAASHDDLEDVLF